MLISQIAALTSTHFRPCSLAILEDLKPTLRDPTFEHHFRRPCCCNLGAGQYAKITNKICIVSVAESEFKPASEPGPIRCSIDVNPQVCEPPSKLALPARLFVAFAAFAFRCRLCITFGLNSSSSSDSRSLLKYMFFCRPPAAFLSALLVRCTKDAMRCRYSL